MMWLDRVLSSPTTHALELTAQFAEQRHRVLVENIANLDTPGYRSRRLDERRFQRVLGEALQRAHESGDRALVLRGDAQFATTPDGRLTTRPTAEGPDRVLFHDGTDARLEELMSDLDDNALLHSLSLRLLRGRFNSLMTAIRGRLG